MTPGIEGLSELQKAVSKSFEFLKILKVREKIFENPRAFFVIVLYYTKKDAHR